MDQVRQLLEAFRADALEAEVAKARLIAALDASREAAVYLGPGDSDARRRQERLAEVILEVLPVFDAWYTGVYRPVAVRWHGMEQAFASWLDENQSEYVAEHDRADRHRGLVFDFIILGAVPTLIEIKYTQYGNAAMADALARTAVAAFGRCRFVLVVVGEASEVWSQVSDVVSAIYYFDPSEVDCSDADDALTAIDRQAGAFVADVMSSLAETPVLDSGSGDAAVGLPLEELFRWSERLQPPIQELFPADPLNALKTVAASFRTIVGSGQSVENVVDHELSELRKEFGSGHYTSCALRLGRCLELVVYAFALSVGISPSSGQFRTLLRVGDKLKTLNTRMVDLAEAGLVRDRDEYTSRRAGLRDAIIDVQAILSNVLSQLDEVAQEDREVRGPDNIQAILRRSVRHLGGGPDASEAKKRLGRLLKDDRARDIIALRNSAAHGDPGLAQREVSRDEVVEQLFSVADYIQELAVVADLSRRAKDPRE